MHIKKERQHRNPRTQWEVSKTINQQKQNHPLILDSSLSYQRFKMHVTDAIYSPLDSVVVNTQKIFKLA